MDFFNRLVEKFLRFRVKMQRWYRLYLSLAMVVVFVTTYILILPALTIDEETAAREPGMSLEGSVEEKKATLSSEQGSGQQIAEDGDEGNTDLESATEENTRADAESSSGEGAQEGKSASEAADGASEAEKHQETAKESGSEEQPAPASETAPENAANPAASGGGPNTDQKDGNADNAATDHQTAKTDGASSADNDETSAVKTDDTAGSGDNASKSSGAEAASAGADDQQKTAGKVSEAGEDSKSAGTAGDDSKSAGTAGEDSKTAGTDGAASAGGEGQKTAGTGSDAFAGGDHSKTAGSDNASPEGDASQKDKSTSDEKGAGADGQKDVQSSYTEAERAEWPAVTLTGENEDVKIRVEAPQGALPAGTIMRLEVVKPSEVQEAVDKVVKEKLVGRKVSSLLAIDLHFSDIDGNEILPAEDIKVAFLSPKGKTVIDDDTVVIYIDEKGEGVLVETKTEKLTTEI